MSQRSQVLTLLLEGDLLGSTKQRVLIDPDQHGQVTTVADLMTVVLPQLVHGETGASLESVLFSSQGGGGMEGVGLQCMDVLQRRYVPIDQENLDRYLKDKCRLRIVTTKPGGSNHSSRAPSPSDGGYSRSRASTPGYGTDTPPRPSSAASRRSPSSASRGAGGGGVGLHESQRQAERAAIEVTGYVVAHLSRHAATLASADSEEPLTITQLTEMITMVRQKNELVSLDTPLMNELRAEITAALMVGKDRGRSSVKQQRQETGGVERQEKEQSSITAAWTKEGDKLHAIEQQHLSTLSKQQEKIEHLELTVDELRNAKFRQQVSQQELVTLHNAKVTLLEGQQQIAQQEAKNALQNHNAALGDMVKENKKLHIQIEQLKLQAAQNNTRNGISSVANGLKTPDRTNREVSPLMPAVTHSTPPPGAAPSCHPGVTSGDRGLPPVTMTPVRSELQHQVEDQLQREAAAAAAAAEEEEVAAAEEEIHVVRPTGASPVPTTQQQQYVAPVYSSKLENSGYNNSAAAARDAEEAYLIDDDDDDEEEHAQSIEVPKIEESDVRSKFHNSTRPKSAAPTRGHSANSPAKDSAPSLVDPAPKAQLPVPAAPSNKGSSSSRANPYAFPKRTAFDPTEVSVPPTVGTPKAPFQRYQSPTSDQAVAEASASAAAAKANAVSETHMVSCFYNCYDPDRRMTVKKGKALVLRGPDPYLAQLHTSVQAAFKRSNLAVGYTHYDGTQVVLDTDAALRSYLEIHGTRGSRPILQCFEKVATPVAPTPDGNHHQGQEDNVPHMRSVSPNYASGATSIAPTPPLSRSETPGSSRPQSSMGGGYGNRSTSSLGSGGGYGGGGNRPASSMSTYPGSGPSHLGGFSGASTMMGSGGSIPRPTSAMSTASSIPIESSSGSFLDESEMRWQFAQVSKDGVAADKSLVLQYVMQRYDDMGDARRFQRLFSRFPRSELNFDEFCIILLRLAAG